MGDQTVSALVEGGKANAGPPLGPSLGALGVNIPQIVKSINDKTKDLAGMKVPIKVIVHEDKSFDVEVGTPPAAALIKKELKLEKGSKEAGKLRVGDLTHEQAKRVATMKFGSDADPFLTQIIGTARSMGISVGQGVVTEEEKQAYEEQKKAEEAAAKTAPEAEGKEESAEGTEEKPEEKKETKEQPQEKPKEKK